MRKFLVFAFIFILAFVFYLDSRPQYSLLQSFGTKCTACHINTQGGGVRTNGGWVSRKDISLIPTTSIGLGGFFDMMSTNSWANDMISAGMDTRLQSAKWGTPGKSNRDFMLMQATPYLVLKPFDWLMLEGQYNIAYNVYTDKRYVGQNPWAASAYLKINQDLPTLRVGYFQPTFGIKWDDHTLLTRQYIGKTARMPIIPDDYTEWGAQLDYESISWLSASAGVFKSNNMAKLSVIDKSGKPIPVVDSTKMAIALRGFVTPELGHGFVGFLGGTYYMNGDYYIGNLHLGIGMPDKFSFLLEYMDTEKKDARRTQALSGEVTYQLTESLLPFVRIEREQVRNASELQLYYSTQYVLGAHVYLLPFIDVLPEYRIFDREHIDGYSSQWALQLHVWY